MIEQSISTAITLFILSMIAERVVTWTKIYFGRQGKTLWLFSNSAEDISKRSLSSSKNKEREMKILGLNIVVSVLTATIANANLFNLMNASPASPPHLGWQNSSYQGLEEYLTAILGCILTGFFISLGSKFWHDTLDLLLQVKNYKEKLVNPKTYENPGDIDQLAEFINTPELKLGQLAKEVLKAELGDLSGLDVGPGYMTLNGVKVGCLEVHSHSKELLAKVKEFYKVHLSSGLDVEVPVNKFLAGPVQVQSSISGAGMQISNTDGKFGWGSLGCVVKKTGDDTGIRYILSCLHVLSDQSDISIPVQKKEINYIEGGAKIDFALFEEGIRNDKLDTALARITAADAKKFNNDMIYNSKVIYDVGLDDAVNNRKVSFYGAASEAERTGTIHNDSWSKGFNYKGTEWKLKDLIVLTRKTANGYVPISEKGDSGSIVLNDKRQIIGMIVGADDFFTYAIKIKTITSHFKIELI